MVCGNIAIEGRTGESIMQVRGEREREGGRVGYVLKWIKVHSVLLLDAS